MNSRTAKPQRQVAQRHAFEDAFPYEVKLSP